MASEGRKEAYPISLNLSVLLERSDAFMVVSVSFFGLQRQLARTDKIQVSLMDKKNVGDVLRFVLESYPDLPLNEENVLVTVNDRVVPLDRNLRADDKISFIPHIGGG